MSLDSRYDKEATVYGPSTATKDEAGGRVEQDGSALYTSFRFSCHRMSPYMEEKKLAEFGMVENREELYRISCDYKADVVAGCVLEVSDAERYKILGAVPQRGVGNTLHHIAAVVVKQKVTP